METTIVYWGHVGLYWDNGKDNEKYYSITGQAPQR